ncbi:MAG: TIGR01212 family radical SAM protein [Planctomycetes bacterium]|nr:TIGR01212 family radical SAM protein [Planctomycetota bacterium]
MAERFPGQIIRKLCLNAGFTCPNIDGKVAKGGCTYCNNDGFVPERAQLKPLGDQWDKGRRYLRRRYRKVDGFIAYFQAFSNTYSSTEELQKLYAPIPSSLEECVGMAISTRPDCLEDSCISFLDQLGKETFLTLEMGLQTDNDEILKKVNRGHGMAEFYDAMERAAHRNFEICVHFVLGFPGEDPETPERLGKLAASLPIHSVKIHNLHIMKGTAMHQQFLKGKIEAIEKDNYLDGVQRFMAQLRPDQAAQRVIADAPDDILSSGNWCQNKQNFLADLKITMTHAQDKALHIKAKDELVHSI